MAIRRVVIWPDESGVVPRGAIQQALLDMEAVFHVAGGVVTLTGERNAVQIGQQDGSTVEVEGVRVTSVAVVEWKDRADARAQAERRQTPAAVSPHATIPVVADVELAAEAERLAAEVRADAEAGVVPPDLALPEDEDVSEIPVALR